MQNIYDMCEWQNFLHTHGRSDIEVWGSGDPRSAVDVMQVSQSTGRKSYVELKMRRVGISDYADCAIDSNKILALQQLGQQTNDNVFLAAMYPKSGKVAIWQIEADGEYRVEPMTANHKTLEVGGPRKREKSVVKLLLRKAKIYNHQFTSTYGA